MESRETAVKIARALGHSLWFLAFCCLFMPGAAFASASGVTCVVTQTSATSDTVTITEAPDTGTGIEPSNCKVSNVFLPTSAEKVNVMEAGIPLSSGASDTLLVNPGGIINVQSDGASKLVEPFSSGLAVIEGPEGTFTPVTWTLSGTKGHETMGTTTFVFFSDVTPEPGTMLLFGTGLLGLGFVLRRRLAV